MLEPVANEPGRWADPSWQGDTPGTFAVIIGCSAYSHLEDGPMVEHAEMDWIKEAQKLGQLYVSALSAKRFFDWAKTDYKVDDAPLVSCRLLLAPTPEEIAADPDIDQHRLAPTMANCRAAIIDWVKEVGAMDEAAQEKSRLLFFFSGHGLQSTHDRQLLLPCDYLGDGQPDWNYAISTENLLHGLARTKVPHRYYFVDACRNDFPEIRQMNPVGETLLTVYPTKFNYRKIRADAVLYATTAASQAWQPKDPGDGPSLFGRALIEGLKGTPSIELVDDEGKKNVHFFKLESFVNDRIVALLAQYQSSEEQTVQPGGTPRDELVTEVDASNLYVAKSGAPSAPTSSNILRLHDVADFPMPEFGGSPAVLPFQSPAFGESHVVPVELQPAGWSQDFNIGHGLFGHESMTDIFSNRMQVASLSDGHQLNVDEYRLVRVDRTEIASTSRSLERTKYRILIAIDEDDEVGHWLQVADSSQSGRGVFLPQDHSMHEYGKPEYLLHVEALHHRGPEKYGAEISRLSAAPHAVGHGSVPLSTRLWHHYQASNAMSAVNKYEGEVLQSIVYQKVTSPLAAIISAQVLLRAHRLDLIHEWLENVANWFPQFSDGAVLWAEQVWRQSDDPEYAVATAIKHLSTIPDRGLPVTSEAISYAASMLRRLAPDLELLDAETRDKMAKTNELVENALTFVRPGGLLTSFAHFEPAGTLAGMTDPNPAKSRITNIPGGVSVQGIRLLH